ncbi:MAG: glycosyltransferase family 4 protein, partial [Patescibacteria group bacterium]
VYNFSRCLADMGHEIIVITPDYFVKKENNNICSGISDNQQLNFKILRLKPWFKYGNAGFIPQLLWKLNNYDIVHLHYPFFGGMEAVVLLKIFFRKKFKLIVHYHMDADVKGFKGLIFKLSNLLILPILSRQAEIITCASIDYIKHSKIAGYYNKHIKKFYQTLFGVDLKQFAVYQNYKNKQKNQKTILFVAGLDKAHYFKGLENLLQAIKILKNSFDIEFNLIVIGEGDLKNYYKNLAKDLKIDKIVNFLDKIDRSKLVYYYNNSNVFVLPSVNKSEAFGLVLLEAMACAKPVIASNLPGVRGVFENNRQGLLIEPNNIEDLAAKLKIILINDNLAKQMGKAGRELVEATYTWEKVAERLNLIYNRILD